MVDSSITKSGDDCRPPSTFLAVAESDTLEPNVGLGNSVVKKTYTAVGAFGVNAGIMRLTKHWGLEMELDSRFLIYVGLPSRADSRHSEDGSAVSKRSGSFGKNLTIRPILINKIKSKEELSK